MNRTQKVSAPCYRLHKPTRQAVVRIQGRDFYLGRYGTPGSREKYDRLLSKWLGNGRRLISNPDPASGLTVNELTVAYWRFAAAYYQKDGKPNTEAANIKSSLRPLQRLYGTTPGASFGPRALKVTREVMIKDGCSRGHVNKQIARIKRMFKWAVENELVPPSVYQALQTVPGLKRGRCLARETEPVKPVSDQYVDAIQPFVSIQVWTMVTLQRITGMRSGEVVIMRRRDLDTAGPIWLYRPESHKTECYGHERIVELGPRAQALLRPFFKPDLDAYLFSPRDAVSHQKAEKRRKRRTKVQPSQRERSKSDPKRVPGGRYTSDSFRRAIRRACDLADAQARKKLPAEQRDQRIVPSWHPHQLRHSFATAVRKQFGIEVARILLGHRSAVVTEIYAEADRAKAREIMARIG